MIKTTDDDIAIRTHDRAGGGQDLDGSVAHLVGRVLIVTRGDLEPFEEGRLRKGEQKVVAFPRRSQPGGVDQTVGPVLVEVLDAQMELVH